jgi:hypothetical protein
MERFKTFNMKRMKFMKKRPADTGLAAAFGGTTSDQERKRESAGTDGALSFSLLLVRRWPGVAGPPGPAVAQ